MDKKLEIGAGQFGRNGYLHNDINAFPGIDIVCKASDVALENDSLVEVLACGVVEHLSYKEVEKTLQNVRRMLVPGGHFYFDVPDFPIWAQYVVDYFDNREVPFSIDHIMSTIYGWQRWPGDEHKSGWWTEKLEASLQAAGFSKWNFGVENYIEIGITCGRMTRPGDAHIFVRATK